MRLLGYIFIVLFKSTLYNAPFSNKLFTRTSCYNKMFDPHFAEIISRPFPNNYINSDIEYLTTDRLYLNDTIHKINTNEKCNIKDNKNVNIYTNNKDKKIYKSNNILNIFPELTYFKWPNWSIRKGYKIKCNKDKDCLFPEACCHDPIIPGDKFCCTNWKKRKLEYAYKFKTIRNHF